MEGMIDLLKSQVPKEQQDMFEMMSMMMSMSEMGDGASKEADSEETVPETDGSENADPISDAGNESLGYSDAEEPPIPEIWQRIAQNIGEEIKNDRPE